MMNTKKLVHPWVRIFILFAAVSLIFILTYKLTGKLFPDDPFESMIFQGALLIVVLGSTVQESHFTTPAESMLNSFLGIITLLPVYQTSCKWVWWIIVSYCLIIFILGVLCTGLSTGKDIPDKHRRLIDRIYHPVVKLGRARILYSIIFIYGLFSYYALNSREFLVLILFWGIFIVIWPLGLPEWASYVFLGNKMKQEPVGNIVRTDWPNIIHINLRGDVSWNSRVPKLYIEADGTQCMVVPLFQQHQGEEVIGTGIYVKTDKDDLPKYKKGNVYEFPEEFHFNEDEITEALGGEKACKLVGFISENSQISEIRYEIINPEYCSEGQLVWCQIGDEKVYYQVLNGVTEEESFNLNRFGFQTGLARQLGKIGDLGFETFDWLPKMNTPVFTVCKDFGEDIAIVDKSGGEFEFGCIPGTKLKMGGDFIQNMPFHTAILGATGTGKTELALDIIRDVADKGKKVICIDLTMKYLTALDGLFKDLTLSEEDAKELNELLFKVEIGQYSKTAEKQALRDFVNNKRVTIAGDIEKFLEKDENQIAIISLPELSNTLATLYLTEIYLTILLDYAKKHPKMDDVLVVVEEAHTVMPEPTTMGDFDSKGLVGKIAQLALQGRKYGIGLLVIAQRTATVSKSILTQCNTVISFRCFDETSLNFFKNTYGPEYTKAIPLLGNLQALVYGKSIKSQRPVIVEIPFDPDKVDNNN